MVKLTEDQDHSVNFGRRGVEGGGGGGGVQRGAFAPESSPPPPPLGTCKHCMKRGNKTSDAPQNFSTVNFHPPLE